MLVEKLTAICMDLFLVTLSIAFAVITYVAANGTIIPSATKVVGTTPTMTSGESAHPKKKYPRAIVDGKDKIIPAMRALTRSATKVSSAINAPPTTNDTTSCVTKLFMPISFYF